MISRRMLQGKVVDLLSCPPRRGLTEEEEVQAGDHPPQGDRVGTGVPPKVSCRWTTLVGVEVEGEMQPPCRGVGTLLGDTWTVLHSVVKGHRLPGEGDIRHPVNKTGDLGRLWTIDTMGGHLQMEPGGESLLPSVLGELYPLREHDGVVHLQGVLGGGDHL